MIAHACASTGWTADQVWDQMTFELWDAFCEEWRLRPPVHWLVGAFVGFKPPPRRSGDHRPVDRAGARSIARDFPGGVIR